METIIEKAREGGYLKYIDMELADGMTYQDYYWVVCDKDFWQALGKSFGLTTNTAMCPTCGINKDWQGRGTMEQWRYHALLFHEINLTEGWDAAIKYLKSITSQSLN